MHLRRVLYRAHVELAAIALAALISVCATPAFSQSTTGDGSLASPIRNRLESRAQLLMGRSNSEFSALIPHEQEDAADAINQFGESADYKAFASKLKTYTEYRDAKGNLVLDSNKKKEDGVTPVTLYFVEEDLALNELELMMFFRQSKLLKEMQEEVKKRKAAFATSFTSASLDPLGGGQAMLRSMGEQGQIVRWVPGSTVSYSVLRWTFGNDTAKYDYFRRNLRLAAAEWERTCDIHFDYREDLDYVPEGSAGPVDAQGRRLVTFTAFQYSLGGAIARAFFPNDPISQRFLIIDPEQYFTTNVDRIGVLRHELGHVLGFRHEHIALDAPIWDSEFCEESSVNSVVLTTYDRASVMHYPCSSTNSGPIPANFRLEITPIDAYGSRTVYGGDGMAPYNYSFRNFDPRP